MSLELGGTCGQMALYPMPILLEFPSRLNAYNKEIRSAKLDDVFCPCCGRKLRRHAYDERTVVWKHRTRTVILLRMRCPSCDETHTIIPSFLLPWQRFANHIREFFGRMLLMGVPLSLLAESLTSWVSSIVSIRTLWRWKKTLKEKWLSWLETMRESAAAQPGWDDLLLDLHRGKGDIVQEMRLLLAFFFGIRDEPVPPPGAVLNRLNLYLPPNERW
jgi:Domain of unknown function (DUF6431)